MTEITTTPGLIGEILTITSDKATYKSRLIELEKELQESDLMSRINKGKEMLKELEDKEKEIKKQGINILQTANIDKFESNGVEVKIKINPGKLIIDDEDLVSGDYKKQVVKTTISIDKEAIKEDMKEGVIVEGVHLEKEQDLHIKFK